MPRFEPGRGLRASDPDDQAFLAACLDIFSFKSDVSRLERLFTPERLRMTDASGTRGVRRAANASRKGLMVPGCLCCGFLFSPYTLYATLL